VEEPARSTAGKGSIDKLVADEFEAAEEYKSAFKQ